MMKTVALLLLATSAFAMPPPAEVMDEVELGSRWTAYKLYHGKSYGSAEDGERYRLFKERLAYVTEHNARYAQGLESFDLIMNDRADLTVAEWLSKNGYTPMGDDVPREDVVAEGALPTTVDWRTKGYVTPVKDQGQCGSCWAFGTTGVLEGQWFKKTGKLISLSESQLVDCDTGNGDMGCQGGLPWRAYDYFQKKGAMTEASYPYHAVQRTCKYSANDVAAHITGKKAITKGSESALQTATATIGPISVGIDAAHTSFQLYHTGVYDEKRCSSTHLDHAVLVVGYGTDGGKDYWLVKNSWNTGWGNKGYIMMSRNKSNQCGIATDASYPTV